MNTHVLDRFSQLVLRNKYRLRNRVVVPPMASATADANGLVTEETLSHYQNLARSGAGLIFVEYTYVHSSGRSEPHQLGIHTDQHTDGLRKISQIIRDSGAIAGIQLTHAGGKTGRAMTGGPLMAPSHVMVPVKDRELEVPDAMGIAEIALWRDAFLASTQRAKEAGFDLVEFHAAHGYGLNQWLSPLTNQREDIYGGTLEGRSHLLAEILTRARALYPELLLSVRIPGQDFLPGGLSGADAIQLAEVLERLGVDILNVSSGIGGWRRPGSRTGQGYLLPEATRIQASTQLPVIGVGGIERGEFIDQVIRSKQVSLAAVGRAILQDSSGWGKAHLQTRG
jgi:NADPH2 dehydrogenase